ncbi:ABC transporter G family member 23 isoform X2 [Folsomia candida]|uniref:ABC transporter G family member 23 isoform X2 n=1 Tax=Folsomia candida TaxID=158441 RepID=UPI0016051608|nr:ABC transporter G family member 23 isoform X2 [Folsomia candida]
MDSNNLAVALQSYRIFNLALLLERYMDFWAQAVAGLGKLDSGQVLVFGKVPGKKDSGIPGPLVGFMPQEVALYPNLTIAEIMAHFGGIYGMQKHEINERTDFLAKFLQLPDTSRLIRSLSGGELRCVSLGVSMIHKPRLLILDEPTAGLDPELRASIWEYLHTLVRNDGKTTVIITTQYIPEATFCDKIGIMRKGRILNEDSPTSMLHRFETRSLEKVFLNLCRLDKNYTNMQLNQKKSDNVDDMTGVLLQSVKTISSDCNKESRLDYDECSDIRVQSDIQIISTLVKKTVLRQIRVPTNVVLLIFIPFLLIFLINSIVGTTPHYFKLGLVTQDWSGTSDGLLEKCDELHRSWWSGKDAIINGTCDPESLEPLTYVCALIKSFPDEKIVWIPTQSEDASLSKVKAGDAIGFIKFPQNFSKNFLDRLIFRNNAELETLAGATISFRGDMSNAVNSGLLRKLIYTSYSKFLQNSATWCGADPRVVQLPLQFHSLYDDGSEELGWSHYIQPASIILIMSVLSSAPGMMTAIEKRLGYLDRDYVAGVKFRHLVASSLLHGSIVIILQLSTTFTFLPLVYGMRSQGPWILVIILVYLSSLSGVALGFVWGISSRHEMDVVMVLLAANIAYIGGAGSMWPLEGVTYWYRQFCYLLPVTLPISTLRSVIHRGWDLTHFQICVGFGGTLFWIIFPIAVASYIYKSRNRR